MPLARQKKRRTADKTIADHVVDYMNDHCRAFTVDALLTRPVQAMRMAIAVAARSERITAAQAKAAGTILETLEGEHPKVMEAINEMCRAALNGRKHGDIKRDRY